MLTGSWQLEVCAGCRQLRLISVQTHFPQELFWELNSPLADLGCRINVNSRLQFGGSCSRDSACPWPAGPQRVPQAPSASPGQLCQGISHSAEHGWDGCFQGREAFSRLRLETTVPPCSWALKDAHLSGGSVCSWLGLE